MSLQCIKKIKPLSEETEIKEREIGCAICLVSTNNVRGFYNIRGCGHSVCVDCEPDLREQGFVVNKTYNAIKCPLCRRVEDIPYEEFLKITPPTQPTASIIVQPNAGVFTYSNNPDYMDFTPAINHMERIRNETELQTSNAPQTFGNMRRIISSNFQGSLCQRCGIRSQTRTNRRCPYHLSVPCCDRCNICTTCDQQLFMNQVSTRRYL